MSESIDQNIIREARRLLDAANEMGVPARATGGIAIALHADRPIPATLARPYQDIDLVTTRKGGSSTLKLLTDLGYEPNQRFNALNSATRLVAYDKLNGRQVDVFVGEFRMCHRIPVATRLQLDRYTIPLAELLLTKLQIVQLNDKDLKDILTLVLDHDIADHDDDAINSVFISELLASDWGLWRTTTGTITRCRESLSSVPLSPDERQSISERLTRLAYEIDTAPKSVRWRMRAKVGERTRWYEEPEEIEHAPFTQPSSGPSQ